MRRTAFLLALLALAFASTLTAEASPGAACTHTPQCGHGEICVADGASSSSTSGHCVRLHVLP